MVYIERKKLCAAEPQLQNHYLVGLVEFMNSHRHCHCPQTIGLNYVFSVCFGLAVYVPAIGTVALCWSAASCFSVYDCDVAAADVVVSPVSTICDCCRLTHFPVNQA